jgi:hypothetical protein
VAKIWPNGESRLPAREPVFIELEMLRIRLLAILLDAGGPQAGQTVLVDRKLPGEEFIDRQRIAAAGFLKGEKATAHSGDDLSFAADDPPFGSGRGQIRNR